MSDRIEIFSGTTRPDIVYVTRGKDNWTCNVAEIDREHHRIYCWLNVALMQVLAGTLDYDDESEIDDLRK